MKSVNVIVSFSAVLVFAWSSPCSAGASPTSSSRTGIWWSRGLDRNPRAAWERYLPPMSSAAHGSLLLTIRALPFTPPPLYLRESRLPRLSSSSRTLVILRSPAGLAMVRGLRSSLALWRSTTATRNCFRFRFLCLLVLNLYMLAPRMRTIWWTTSPTRQPRWLSPKSSRRPNPARYLCLRLPASACSDAHGGEEGGDVRKHSPLAGR